MPLELHLTLTRDLLWISVIFSTKSNSLLVVYKGSDGKLFSSLNLWLLLGTCTSSRWPILSEPHLGGNRSSLQVRVGIALVFGLFDFVCVCVWVCERGGGRWLKSHPALSTESVDIGVDITSVPIKFSYMIEVNWASMTRHLCRIIHSLCMYPTYIDDHVYRWPTFCGHIEHYVVNMFAKCFPPTLCIQLSFC